MPPNQPWVDLGMREVVIHSDLLGVRLVEVTAGLVASSYIAPARGGGLTATFSRVGLSELHRRFWYLAVPLAEALDPRRARPLWSANERLWGWLLAHRPNAFSLRVHLLRHGFGIGPRVANTLQQQVNAPVAHPRLVSLFVFSAPDAAGVLRLARAGRVVSQFEAYPGVLAQWRGDLEYTLQPVAAGIATWVLLCEQYCFAEALVARLPTFTVHSAARFSAVLAAAKDKPTPGIVVDSVDGETHAAADPRAEE